MILSIFDYAKTSPDERSFIERTFGHLTMLSQVLDWGRREQPPVVVADIITQDEYTHDVLLPFVHGRYLNFDTT